ncbi:MAG TPA: PEGA domain-containing protein [Polyangia bacterium]|nr:PEGA domain-containing protein [Polyangia bacterium]
MARLKPNAYPGPPGRGRSEAPPPSGGGTGKQQVIQVATRCATLDEFVEKFAAFAWEGSLVLPAATALPVGTQGQFVILLKDHAIAMRGRCRVTEAKPTPVSSRNPAVKRMMMRVALLEMDEASRAVHKRLIALRSAPVPLPIPPEPSETTQIEPARGGTAPGAAAPVAAVPPAAAPVPAPAAVPPAAAAPPVAAPPPAAAVLAPPILPVKTPPPAPPVHLNRTMIGVGISPITASASPSPAPRPAAPAPTTVPIAPATSLPGMPAARVAPPPAAPAAPSETPAETPAATAPRVETRVPGAPDQLPANPLAQFDADDVESFIECRLLETDAEAPAGAGAMGPEESMAVATDIYRRPRETAVVRLQELAKRLPPRFQKPALRAAPYAPAVGLGLVCFIVGVVISRSGHKTPPVPPPVIVQAPAPAAAPPVAEPALPPAPDPQAVVARAPEATKSTAPPPAPARKEKERSPAPEMKAPRPAKAAEEAAPEPVAAVEKPARAEKPAAKPAPAARATEPASGDCTARIVTEPKDAKVIWGGTMLGRSPIEGARVPCGAASVTIERERWQPVTVDVNAQAGTAADVHERLRRPRSTLSVTSTPPGAHVVINRVAAGAAPKELDVQRFEKLQIKATLKGHQPWTKSVYLKDADAKLDIQMVPRK